MEIIKSYFNQISKTLGYEYNDNNLTSNYLYEKIHSKTIPIKTMLLDQSLIAGIGNIYANEILFLCRINPNRVRISEEGYEKDYMIINGEYNEVRPYRVLIKA